MQVKVAGSIFHLRSIKMNPEREKIRSADALAPLTLPTLRQTRDITWCTAESSSFHNVVHRRKLFVGWVIHKPFHNIPNAIPSVPSVPSVPICTPFERIKQKSCNVRSLPAAAPTVPHTVTVYAVRAPSP